MTDPPKGTKIAPYLRCSTDGQEFSIEGQRGVIKKEAERREWESVSEFVDEGESGATTGNRPGLQRLLIEAATKQFDLIVMYDVSRITRGGASELWMLVYRLKGCGVQLFCCARQLLVSEKNALLFTVDAMQAREENIKRSKDATRGLYQSIFLRDQDPGRRPPFGFDQMRVEIATGKEVERIRYLNNGTKQVMTPDASSVIRVIPINEEYHKGTSLRTVLVPGDQKDVEMLRHIFRQARTLGLKRTANDLNKENLLSPTGEKWCCTSLRHILSNQAYLGRRVCNQSAKGRYHHHGRDGVVAKDEAVQGRELLIRRPESEWNIWENKHEALIDEALFWEVQEARKRRRGNKIWNRKGRNQCREYLLSSGFIKCLRCEEGHLNGTTVASKGYRYPKYYCSSNTRLGHVVCAGYSLPMDPLDEFVLREVRASVTAPECLAALESGLAEEFTRRLELHKPLGSDEVEVLKGERAGIERARRQIVDAVKGDPGVIAFMKPEIERLAEQAAALDKKLKMLKPALDKSKISEMVKAGILFYQERVLGPLEALAPKKTTEVAGTVKPEAADTKGNATEAKRHEERPCLPELKEMLRLLGVKLAYDPDRKEGTLEFDPF